MSIFYCLYFWDSPPTWKARFLYLFSPRNRVAQLYPRGIVLTGIISICLMSMYIDTRISSLGDRSLDKAIVILRQDSNAKIGQPHRHLWADCLYNVGSSTSHNSTGLQGLLQGIALPFPTSRKIGQLTYRVYRYKCCNKGHNYLF
jgi:hypothetical protein